MIKDEMMTEGDIEMTMMRNAGKDVIVIEMSDIEIEMIEIVRKRGNGGEKREKQKEKNVTKIKMRNIGI